MIYDSKIITQVLPHRYPFLLVDRVLEHKMGEQAVCLKNVTSNEEVFSGHFPNDPIYPGVLQIEMGLQTTILMYADLAALVAGEHKDPWRGFFVAADKIKLKAAVYPGDSLYITATHQQGVGAINRVGINIINQDNIQILKGIVTVTGPE